MTNYSIPKIKVLNASRETIEHFNPFADIVSSARTCYSAKGIVLPQQIDAEDQLNENNDFRISQREVCGVPVKKLILM